MLSPSHVSSVLKVIYKCWYCLVFSSSSSSFTFSQIQKPRPDSYDQIRTCSRSCLTITTNFALPATNFDQATMP
jgi:hypothetical protein